MHGGHSSDFLLHLPQPRGLRQPASSNESGFGSTLDGRTGLVMRESVKPQFAEQYHPGDLISGRYLLEELLGEGGMGAVWRARNVALDAPVAVKVLSSKVQKSALHQRLLVEARAAAKVAHPAIVKVFDVGQTDRAEPYIVMELLTGTSLGAVLRKEGRLSGVQAVRTLLPIADALEVAHGKGVIHRDVKPDNIFIVHDASVVQPKLVDFGIVKVERSEGSGSLTRDGVIMGSPTYLSPEQARGDENVDHRTDVWAFSVMLYEVISGRMPFEAANYNALLRQIVEDTPPTLRDLLAADVALSAIVARGLSKPREERFQSMAEMGRALAQWLFEAGETHDICGTSLENKWFSDPDPWESTPFGAPWRAELGSGVRHPAPRPLETVRAPTPEATAASTGATPSAARRRSRGTPLLILGGLATTAAFAVAWTKQQETTAVAAPASSAVAATGPAIPSAPPGPSVVPTSEPAPRASAAPAASVAPPPPTLKGSRQLKKPPSSHKPPKPPPTSDLIKPY
jgi:eukaryotic-like serine/threonine-protein kinase